MSGEQGGEFDLGLPGDMSIVSNHGSGKQRRENSRLETNI